jgi:hypothetical protein
MHCGPKAEIGRSVIPRRNSGLRRHGHRSKTRHAYFAGRRHCNFAPPAKKILQSQLCKTQPDTPRLLRGESRWQFHHSHTSICCAAVPSFPDVARFRATRASNLGERPVSGPTWPNQMRNKEHREGSRDCETVELQTPRPRQHDRLLCCTQLLDSSEGLPKLEGWACSGSARSRVQPGRPRPVRSCGC